MTILVVGGAGMFGSRLVDGILATMDVDVVIAGRSKTRLAERVAILRRRFGPERIRFATLDSQTVTALALKAIRARVVVDAAGPYQTSNFSLAQAAIAAGLDYVDLADARAFVAAFPLKLDETARAANVLAVTGMSSTPALSHAVLDHLTTGWRRIDRVDVGISPGSRVRMGRSVMQAVLSWVGQPVRVFENGGWRTRPGWSGHVTRIMPDLGRRRFALAETADLDCLIARYRPVDAGVFRAGLELPLFHWSVAALSFLPRLGLVRALSPLAPVLGALARAFAPLGTDRGVMLVEALGRNAEDRPVAARWTLRAEAGDGPSVPTLPALALLRRLCQDRASLGHGARIGAGLLTLEEISAEFPRLALATATERTFLLSPLQKALADRLLEAPQAVRQAHSSGPVARFAGTAAVEGAATRLAALVGRLFGFPQQAAAVPVQVVMRLEADGSETWSRDFGGRRFSSRLMPIAPGYVSERFGPFTFTVRVETTARDLTMEVVGWRLGPLPLPGWLCPRSKARETMTAEGMLAFDVPIRLPLIGQAVRYQGALTRVNPTSDERSPASPSPPGGAPP